MEWNNINPILFHSAEVLNWSNMDWFYGHKYLIAIMNYNIMWVRADKKTPYVMNLTFHIEVHLQLFYTHNWHDSTQCSVELLLLKYALSHEINVAEGQTIFRGSWCILVCVKMAYFVFPVMNVFKVIRINNWLLTNNICQLHHATVNFFIDKSRHTNTNYR